MATALGAVAILLFGTSCTKEETNGGSPSETTGEVKDITNQRTQNEIEAYADRIPAISWYNSTMDKIITFDPKSETKNFSFATPNDSWNYSDNSDTEWVPASGGGGTLFVGPGSFGGNAAGGLVVAGNTTLNINNTMCFSASDEALGLDIGGFGGPEFDGISGVIGISGDFEALMNEDFSGGDMDIFEYFYGLAFYIVYDNEASGGYDILNWLDDVDGDVDDFGGNGFAWVYSFGSQSWEIYFSHSGELNVSGGTMNFNGSYYGIQLNVDNIYNSDDDGDLLDFDFVEVDGYGAMGCN